MPFRNVILAQGEIYHVYNRGVAASPIFLSLKDYSRFLSLIGYCRFENTPAGFSQIMKLSRKEREKILAVLKTENKIHLEILAFCLMPNHFHFLFKQSTEKGISLFMSALQNSYVKYFNIKGDRAGPLFQSRFKAVRILTDEQLIHVSRYIHLNPSTGYLVEPKELLEYKWSSLGTYLKQEKFYSFVQTETISDFFKSKKSYQQFVIDQADYQRELDKIKHLTLE